MKQPLLGCLDTGNGIVEFFDESTLTHEKKMRPIG